MRGQRSGYQGSSSSIVKCVPTSRRDRYLSGQAIASRSLHPRLQVATIVLRVPSDSRRIISFIARAQKWTHASCLSTNYSLFTLRKPCNLLILNGERGFPRVNRPEGFACGSGSLQRYFGVLCCMTVTQTKQKNSRLCRRCLSAKLCYSVNIMPFLHNSYSRPCSNRQPSSLLPWYLHTNLNDNLMISTSKSQALDIKPIFLTCRITVLFKISKSSNDKISE